MTAGFDVTEEGGPGMMRWSCLGGSEGGIGHKGEISPSLPYTLQQRRQSKIPGPPVRTPMF